MEWLTPKQLKEYLGFSLSAQSKMRSAKRIPFHKAGNYIRYNRIEIDEWMISKKVV